MIFESIFASIFALKIQNDKDMITKKYLKSKPVCKVTFEVKPEQANGAKQIALAGEFNGWSADATPLKKSKEGVYKVTLDLEPGKAYEFKYVLNDENWENDWAADSYTDLNSVVAM